MLQRRLYPEFTQHFLQIIVEVVFVKHEDGLRNELSLDTPPNGKTAQNAPDPVFQLVPEYWCWLIVGRQINKQARRLGRFQFPGAETAPNFRS